MHLNRALAVVGAIALSICTGHASTLSVSQRSAPDFDRNGTDILLVSERHRHHVRRHANLGDDVDPGDEAGNYGAYPAGNGSFGATRGYDTFGYPANSPYRPWGAQTAITAPPGTAAAAEQANQRRYFCNWAPERCP